MSLLKRADFQAPAKTNPSKKVYELVRERIHDAGRPMPPPSVGQLGSDEVATFDAWLDTGASAAPDDAACDATARLGDDPTPPTEPAMETCYDFKLHGSTTSVDDTPFSVPAGETYVEFYFDVPWPQGTVATRFIPKLDNAQLHHEWFLYSTNANRSNGEHMTTALPSVIGLDPRLLAAWIVGSPALVAPENVGIELPDPGRTLDLMWHFVNSSGAVQPDASVLQICTVPAAQRAHTASFTALGTEDLNGNVWTGDGSGMPPMTESTYTTECNAGRNGLGADEPIHVLGFMPHMHRLGTRMRTQIKQVDGALQGLFDEAYSFGQTRYYPAAFTLDPGQRPVTSCTFYNPHDYGVPYGDTSDLEMCYQFTLAYPAHALDNGAFSLLGWSNACW